MAIFSVNNYLIPIYDKQRFVCCLLTGFKLLALSANWSLPPTAGAVRQRFALAMPSRACSDIETQIASAISF